jgi:hypothetical protein
VPFGAFVIPLIMIFDYGLPDPHNPAKGWENFYLEGTRVMVFVLLPLFFVVVSTLLIQIEVRNNTWKQVLAAPQSYFNILISKFVMLQLAGIALVVFHNIFMIMGAGLLDLLYGVNFLSYLSHWKEMLRINTMAWGSTIGISAVCFWLALRSKNFIIPIVVGFLLWVAGPFAALEFKWPHADKYVFALQFAILSKKLEHEQLLHLLLSIGYGFLFLGGAYAEFVLYRKKVFDFARSKKIDIGSNN